MRSEIETTFEEINNELNTILFKQYRDQYNSVLNQDQCDIESDFLGFVEQYYLLSKVIPKHFTVIDFGCAYAPQAYYFIDHKKYIGIDYCVLKRFTFKNTEHKLIAIETELSNWVGKDTSQIFAICNYVPTGTFNIRRIFQNLFIYYPAGYTSDILLK